MRLNTHDRTPRKTYSKSKRVFLTILTIMFYGIWAFAAILCFCYGSIYSILSGIWAIFLAVYITSIFSDICRAYVEINDDQIHVVDYYLFMKREKYFTFQDIASAELESNFFFSHYIRGNRYIVLKNLKKKYLFKIIYVPETKDVFKKYVNIFDSHPEVILNQRRMDNDSI